MSEISFPIQIGLSGAPGSHKRQVADEFVRISADWFFEQGSEFRVIENAGTIIERDLDQAMGLLGSWAEDLRAYFIRYEEEQKARDEGVSWLTLGTACDNIAHCGTNLENIVTGLQTPDQQLRIQKQQVAMTALTFLFQEQFRYLFGFYLPHPGQSIVLPGQDDTESTYNQRVDQGLRIIFGNFGLRIQMLEGTTPEEQAQEMFDTVKRIVENGPELPPEPAKDEEVPPVAEVTLSE